jgi:formiminoglutamase
MPQLKLYTPEDIRTFINKRAGETKLGEMIQLSDGKDIEHSLSQSAARFVILGLPEDIGIRANNGIGGAHTAWLGFLKSFLNIQHNHALSGADFLLLGHLDFTDWMDNCIDADLQQLRDYTAHIDDEVYPLIQAIVSRGKIPIVVGGGHNNAYPLLKGTSMALNKPVNAVNLDAHSDFRMVEGRHSGNGFRYAYQEGFLKKYAMLGLHEAYNSADIVSELKSNPDLLAIFWEDIFLRKQYDWGIGKALVFVCKNAFGVELDLDCIENVMSSAATPVGVSSQQAMEYLYRCGSTLNAVYLHLPEGVTQRADGQQNIFTGKLLSYLVQAFAKGVLERPA